MRTHTVHQLQNHKALWPRAHLSLALSTSNCWLESAVPNGRHLGRRDHTHTRAISTDSNPIHLGGSHLETLLTQSVWKDLWLARKQNPGQVQESSLPSVHFNHNILKVYRVLLQLGITGKMTIYSTYTVVQYNYNYSQHFQLHFFPLFFNPFWSHNQVL